MLYLFTFLNMISLMLAVMSLISVHSIIPYIVIVFNMTWIWAVARKDGYV